MFNYLTTRVPEGYRVTHVDEPGVFFTVTKPNGKMVCDCPEYPKAPKGTCEHISQVVEYHRAKQATPPTRTRTVSRNRYPGRMGTLSLGLPPRPISPVLRTQPDKPTTTPVRAAHEAPSSGVSGFSLTVPAKATETPTAPPKPPTTAPLPPAEPSKTSLRLLSATPPATSPANGPAPRPAAPPARPALPEIHTSPTAQRLELPFRPDQIKQKDGAAYLDGASVIQRLNDALGTENWSFRLLGEPREVREEVSRPRPADRRHERPASGQGRLRRPRAHPQALRQVDRLFRGHPEVGRHRLHQALRPSARRGAASLLEGRHLPILPKRSTRSHQPDLSGAGRRRPGGGPVKAKLRFYILRWQVDGCEVCNRSTGELHTVSVNNGRSVGRCSCSEQPQPPWIRCDAPGSGPPPPDG